MTLAMPSFGFPFADSVSDALGGAQDSFAPARMEGVNPAVVAGAGPVSRYSHEGPGGALHRTCCARKDGFELVWPEAVRPDWDTAFLHVRISSESSGSPYLSVGTEDTIDRQHFLAGDEGPRWLNLSGLRELLRPGLRLRICGHRMTIDEAPTTLRVFANCLDLSKPMLVLAPHPDDAEIAAFGLYAHRDATIVTITPGNAGTPLYGAMFHDVAEQYAFKGHIRVIDSVTIPWQGRISPERCFNLGYFDARLQEMYGDPDKAVREQYSDNEDISVYRRDNFSSLLPTQPRASTWTNLVEDVLSVLRKMSPGIIVTPHPLLDLHPDHQFTTVALAEALEHWQAPAKLLLYSNHVAGGGYPYGPAGTLMSLPASAEEVTLDRVYSHPLSERMQRLKLFALESMHDIRHEYRSYLRRGPRSNELFYVYDERSIRPVIEKFLAGRPQPS